MTALSVAARCARCFHEIYVLGRRPAGFHLVEGRAAHHAVAVYEKCGRNLRVASSALASYARTLPPQRLARVQGFLERYHSDFGARSARARLVEHPVEFTLGGLTIYGRVDLLEQDQGLYELVEFKSGVRPDWPALEVQCAAYALGIARSADLQPDRWSVHLLASSRRKTLPSTRDERTIVEVLTPVVRSIEAGRLEGPGANRCRFHRKDPARPRRMAFLLDRD